MTSDDRERPPESPGGVAAPPVFGVAARSDRHLLPVATAMGDLLDASDDEVESLLSNSGATKAVRPSDPVAGERGPEAEAVRVPMGTLPAIEKGQGEEGDPLADMLTADANHPASASAAVASTSGAHAATSAASRPIPGDAREGGRRRGAWLPLALLLLVAAGLGGYALTLGASEDASPSTAADAEQREPRSRAPERGSNDSPPARPSVSLEEKLALANDLAAIKSLPLEDRHQLLAELAEARATDRVNLDIQIALDLMQAPQSTTPCEVFADALTLIEGAPDKTPYLPAINEVTRAPAAGADDSDEACRGLQGRLDALKAQRNPAAADAVDPDAASGETPADDPLVARKRSRKRKRKQPTTPAAAPTPAPDPVAAPAAPEPDPTPDPPERRGSIASKLDDGLRPPD